MIRERVSDWLDRQPTDVLVRLEAVEPEKWHPMITDYWLAKEYGMPGSGCLVCHALGCETATDYTKKDDELRAVEFRYMALSERFGDARVGRAISARARRILKERAGQQATGSSPSTGSGSNRPNRSLRPVPTHVTVSLPTRGDPVEVGAS